MVETSPEHLNLSKYQTISNIISFLDIFLAIIIILTASQIMQTPLGGATFIFGFIMLSIVTSLKILQKI